jgi:hypothetical protein
MPEVSTPWIGLAALAAMVVLPLLPTWFLEGPRRIRPWPREHYCAKCDGAWSISFNTGVLPPAYGAARPGIDDW